VDTNGLKERRSLQCALLVIVHIGIKQRERRMIIDFKTIYDMVLKKREEAPNCVVCKVKLFDAHQCLSDYLYSGGLHLTIPKEDIWYFFDMLDENYPFKNQEKKLVVHHISYEKNITIPVCCSCHQKIHKDKTSKYYPIDKKGSLQHYVNMPFTEMDRLEMKNYVEGWI